MNAELGAAGLFVAASLLGVIGAYVFSYFAGTDRRLRPASTTSDERAVFLFEGDRLVDASRAGTRLIGACAFDGTDWRRLLGSLRCEFPALPDRPGGFDDLEATTLPGRDGSARLEVRRTDGLLRLEVLVEGSGDGTDDRRQAAVDAELRALRAGIDATPAPAWRQDAIGRITWVNLSYMRLAERHAGGKLLDAWPPPSVFSAADLAGAPVDGPPSRISIKTPDGQRLWFDCRRTLLDGESLFTAVDTSAAVNAESRLRDFTQTLTRTFAQISVGLAIFDERRRLTLFNPALTDLLGLPVEFLTRRPRLAEFFDHLRESGKVPEPKNYAEWRSRISNLENASDSDLLSEIWSLPSGQTIRVMGRPHADGAVVYFFEDITPEIVMTRRFRSEVETAMCVIDDITDAVAVFSESGFVAFTNAAYTGLWGLDSSSSPTQVDIDTASQTWFGACAPTTIWREVRDFVVGRRDGSAWAGKARLRDGRLLFVRLRALPGGSTAIYFKTGAEEPSPLELHA